MGPIYQCWLGRFNWQTMCWNRVGTKICWAVALQEFDTPAFKPIRLSFISETQIMFLMKLRHFCLSIKSLCMTFQTTWIKKLYLYWIFFLNLFLFYFILLWLFWSVRGLGEQTFNEGTENSQVSIKISLCSKNEIIFYGFGVTWGCVMTKFKFLDCWFFIFLISIIF